MANLVVKDGSGNSAYIKATGAGTDIDPLVLDRTDATLAAIIGEKQASPTQYTLLDRVKALITGISLAASSAVIGHVVVDSGAVTSTLSATDEGLIGSLTETAPATDTASSGLNGRLQRLAQRITSLIALLPAALGAGGGLKVDGSGTALPISGNVTNAGTFATQSTLQAGTNNVGVVTPLALPANEIRGQSGAITNNTSTQVIAAQGANVKIYMTSLLVTNSHATVGTLVTIQDDAGTPVKLFEGYAAPAGGGFAITFPVPPSTTANQKLMALCATTGSNVYVSAVGFKGA